MEKSRLELDALKVESFVPAPAEPVVVAPLATANTCYRTCYHTCLC